jgi:hypothetical protein
MFRNIDADIFVGRIVECKDKERWKNEIYMVKLLQDGKKERE